MGLERRVCHSRDGRLDYEANEEVLRHDQNPMKIQQHVWACVCWGGQMKVGKGGLLQMRTS